MRLLLAGLLTALGLSSASAATIDALYKGLETSDTGAVTRFVADYYRDAGISTNDTLTWETQGFLEIVNWYNQYTEVILLSALPDGTAEADAYWQNWADILTGGTWNWRAFFKDDAEAALLANFNQFLLAAHEYGHALTYRYDPGHEERGGYEINCREYPADRLAAALLEELAEQDARIAALKSRYQLLIAQINTHIAPENRYQLPAFAELDADCKMLHIEQPTDDPATMTPYASAFFVRHGLLQAEDLPPLAEIYESHLFPYWRQRQLPSSGLAAAVTTGEPIADPVHATETGLPDGRTHLAFDADGNRYIVDAGYRVDGGRLHVAFRYGRQGQPMEQVIAPIALPEVTLGEFRFFNFASAISLGPDRFIVSTGQTFGGVPSLLVDVRRRGGTWSLRVVDLEPDPDIWGNVIQTGVVLGPGGSLYALLLVGDEWRRMQLDPQTLATIAATTFTFPLATALAVGPNDETYLAADYRIAVIDAEGKARAFAGAGLQGVKDNADPLLAEFALERPDGFLGPGGMQVVDYDRTIRSHVLRHIALAGR